MSLIGHLARTIFHTFFRLALTVIVCAVLGAGAVLGLAYFWAHQWPPDQVTVIAAAVAGVLLAYAGGLTVLLSASAHALLDTARYAQKETFSAGNMVEHGVKAASHLID
jgi:hypothetical protein